MKTYFSGADILLPAANTDMSKWAVVACDQYTSQPEYWHNTSNYIGDAPSALQFILPECFLEDVTEETIAQIHQQMDDLYEKDFFIEYKDALIYVERTDSMGNMRAGLVGKIDLEEYDYHAGSISKIRPTEATIVERIPPRMKVRQDALLESPHIMLLIDDTEQTVIEPLGQCRSELKVVYDFPLMNGGGHIKGYLVEGTARKNLETALKNLCSDDFFVNRYGMPDQAPVYFATGDGNHSLATAKACYNHLKRTNPEKDLSNHPARYALVELVNLHSPALEFEAIHRVITKTDVDALLANMMETLGLVECSETNDEAQQLGIVQNGQIKEMVITKPTSKLTVGSLQQFLDEYLEKHAGEIDYIHGDDVVCELTQQPESIGFLLPDPAKKDLFPSVIADGALPRKTFSMGHADDKRYYLECRKIKE